MSELEMRIRVKLRDQRKKSSVLSTLSSGKMLQSWNEEGVDSQRGGKERKKGKNIEK